ncbi:MAG TPA: hypothetical protein VHI10_18605 [Mycobacterium sp.]|nr:hypothetical protein [Mycobacterium sp.]
MKRLSTLVGSLCAGVTTAVALWMPGVASAASAVGDKSFPLPDGTNLEMHTTLNCPLPDRQCYFTVQAQRRRGAVVEGFPWDLWARKTTTIRSMNEYNYLETQVVAENTRVFKAGGTREITTIYFGGGPPQKYFIHGRIQPTDWRTGQPLLDADVIVCSHIQVVYAGVNITSPDACAQTTFS